MLIIKVKDGTNIEKALKIFKRKFSETKVIQTLREREQFVKPSAKRREVIKKARYLQKKKYLEERE